MHSTWLFSLDLYVGHMTAKSMFAVFIVSFKHTHFMSTFLSVQGLIKDEIWETAASIVQLFR